MGKVSRREFVVAAAVAGMAPAIAPLNGAPAPDSPPAAAGPAANPEVEARLQWIFTKYGARLSDEQRADIRRILGGGQAAIDQMRAFPLINSEEPVTRFRVWRRA